jgi:hypothetical protein
MSGASAKSLEVFERALRALNIYRGDPTAIIDEALAALPDFAMGHVLRAQVQVTMWGRSVLPGIRASVARLEALQGALNDHERRHAVALSRRDGRIDREVKDGMTRGLLTPGIGKNVILTARKD